MLLKRLLCLNTATIKKIKLDQQIEVAVNSGFNGIGLWVDDIQQAITPENSILDISHRIRASALKVTELCFIGLFKEAGRKNFSQQLTKTEELCRLARDLDCKILVGVPAMKKAYIDFSPDEFHQIGEIAAAYKVKIALEFPGTADRINNIASAWQLVEQAKSDNIGLVIDTFHFFLGNSNIADLKKIPAEKILLVHVSDAMDVSRQMLCTHHDYRTFPGEGVINYKPVFRQLSKINYKGAFSLEIWNQNLLNADPNQVAQKGYTSLANLVRLYEAQCQASSAKQPTA